MSSQNSSPNTLAPAWPPSDPEVAAALQSAWADGSLFQYEGRHGKRLADLLADAHETPHVQLCCSGTVAVELALRGLRIGPGDEVILAAYDYPGNFRCIEAVGAKPVLVDVRPHGWSLDPEQLPGAMSEQVRAIVVSHLHGELARVREVSQFARQNGLAVVEDACQVPGARIGGRMAGSWGDVAVLSFGGSKLLTAGRGGAVLTGRDDVAQRIKIYSQRGNQALPLSELQAAVLVPQWEKLASRNGQRRAAVHFLQERLQSLEGLGFATPREDEEPVYYKLGLLLESPLAGLTAREVFLECAQRAGLAIDVGFPGFAGRSNRRCRSRGPLPGAAQAARHTVLLHHPILLGQGHQLEQLAETLQAVYGQARARLAAEAS